MTKSEAKLYLFAMANGIDPITGEVLPDDHLLREEAVCQALRMAAKALSTDNPAPEDAWIRKNGKLNAGRPWTQSDNDELLCLYREQVPIEEIARRLQRRTRGVNNQLKHLLSPGKSDNRGKPWTTEEESCLLELIASQLTLREIADRMGRSVLAIEMRLARLGFGDMPAGLDDE